ncbi:hypothetical protein CM19_00705 [Candidatus Acidianus copahuensis]|uniref:HTH bat-type domain-containing protein n=1 Tax=Candidatus Acidianus copahuensis TaxID=1160895 RepID=A0A031LT38_9CREN|nr:hypothetical protein CM19_00705 [Candidatus Acidianus copahuensis]
MIKRLKNDRAIRSVKVIHVENSYVIVEIKTVFQGTISKLLYDHGVSYFQNLFDNNHEIWNIIYNDKSLINEIRNEGKVIDVKSSELSLDTIMKVYYNMLLNNLSPRQLTVLKTAYNMGYFNFPRKVRVNKLSSSLGISETTVIQHIRAAEHEILRKLFSLDNQD